MPNGVHASCTADVSPHGRQWPPLPSLTLWLAPSFLHVQIDTWCRGRQTGGLSAPAPPEMWPSCQPSNPVQPPPEPGRNSRLVPPSSSRLEARQTTQPSSTLQTARRAGGERFASEIRLHSSLEIKPNHVTRRPGRPLMECAV